MGFSKLNINPKLLEGIKHMGFTSPTPIQEKCIPEIKAGRDLVGQSLTGSGKTAAFGLPILEKIVPGAGVQALVLTPTRELCHQVRDHLEQMSKFMPINITSIFGGVGYYQQIEELKYAEIIVATPGRLLDLIDRRNVNLKNIKFVVLDEADKMFEMGFEEDVDKILRTTPNTRQTIMFSATMPKAAQNIIKRYLKNPALVQEKLQVDKSLLKQVFYSVRKDEKFSLLVHLLKEKTPGPAIVFCGTKREVDKVAQNLKREKIHAMPVHGDLRQGRRQFAVNSFKEGKTDVLVATDVAARGLDIKDVTHVYNYDVPRTPEEYTHRIGRTARAGKKGDAVTFLSERDYNNFNKIVRFGKMDIVQEKVPEYVKVEYKKEIGRDGFADDYNAERGERRGFSHGHGRGFSPSRNDGRFGGTRGFGGDRGRDRGRSFGGRSEGNFGPRRESSFGNRDDRAPRERPSGAQDTYTARPAYGAPRTEGSSFPRRAEGSFGGNRQSSYERNDNYPRRENSFGNRDNRAPRENSYGNKPSYGAPRRDFNSTPRTGSFAPRQNNYSQNSSPRYDTPMRQDNFPRQDPYHGQKHHRPSPTFKPQEKKEGTHEHSTTAGMEKTPRTHEPLFDNSHYSEKYTPKEDTGPKVLPELRREAYIDHQKKHKIATHHKARAGEPKPSLKKKKYIHK